LNETEGVDLSTIEVLEENDVTVRLLASTEISM
jgi:hypothetical protein